MKKAVERAPGGLDTFVTKQISDNGIDFSGGEKQKLQLLVPSIKMADKIFVLNKGSIVEHGTLNDLLTKEGIFAEFYEMQSSFYK